MCSERHLMHSERQAMLRLQIHLLVHLSALGRRLARTRNEEGQATAEYALVLLGAAALAGLLVAWAMKTDVIGRLLDSIFSRLLTKADQG